MKRWLLALLGVACFALLVANAKASRATLIVVAGAGGEAGYDEAFAAWAANWKRAGEAAGARIVTIGLSSNEKNDLEALRTALEQEPAKGVAPLWLVLLGHGAADAGDAKFNLRGDDLSAADLADRLKRFQRPLILITAFSASGAFLSPLAAPGRVLITATKAGAENNFSRLGKYLSESIGDPAADLDHDGQTSLLEAWLAAAQRVADFYKSEGRLATEHSLLDDNGDGKGTPADWFSGIRLTKRAQTAAVPDGLHAYQTHLLPNDAEKNVSAALLEKRKAFEAELAKLRDEKSTLPEAGYYLKLEAILLELARMRREIGAGATRTSTTSEGR